LRGAKSFWTSIGRGSATGCIVTNALTRNIPRTLECHGQQTRPTHHCDVPQPTGTHLFFTSTKISVHFLFSFCYRSCHAARCSVNASFPRSRQVASSAGGVPASGSVRGASQRESSARPPSTGSGRTRWHCLISLHRP
jgi:hypothetical protein